MPHGVAPSARNLRQSIFSERSAPRQNENFIAGGAFFYGAGGTPVSTSVTSTHGAHLFVNGRRPFVVVHRLQRRGPVDGG